MEDVRMVEVAPRAVRARASLEAPGRGANLTAATGTASAYTYWFQSLM
jgi:hypothetical protein